MKAMLCRIFTAALCVLLLAGCGTKAKTEDLRQSARETRSAGRQDVFDPPGTKRTQVQDPDITVSVQWAAGAEGDEAIRAVITEYFTLMATVLSAPDRTYEHAACCSDKALQELCLYGWMASTALYPEIRLQAAISRPVEYPDGMVQVTASMDMALRCCRDISRSSFTSDDNMDSVDFSEDHQLTLSKADGRWVVDWDAFSSSFSRMESGYATDHQNAAFCREPIVQYFAMRANALDGGYVASDSGSCISTLRSDAFTFAEDLLKDRSEILRVYRAESRAVNLGQFRRIDGDAATQIPVDEFIRVEYLSENWTVECSIFQVTHTITTFPQADSEQNIVVGDLYKRFGHECSIVEYPEPLWSD